MAFENNETVDRFHDQLMALGLKADNLARAKLVASQTGNRLARTLVDLGFLSDTAVADALAAVHRAPRVDTSDWPREVVLPDKLPAHFLLRHRLMPLTSDAARIRLAVCDPTDRFSIRAAELATGLSAELRIATAAEIDANLAQLYDATSTSGCADTELAATGDEQEDLAALRDMASDAPVVRLVNQLFNQAAERGASDIHLETTVGGLRVRLRIHGRMVEVEAPPRMLRAAILSRIKLLAGMDIAEHRLPQDGRIKSVVRGRSIDMRVASLPTPGGESITIRVLDRSAVRFDFTELGFAEDATARLRAMVRQDHGIVLVTGPTGSGKTTTLYTAVQDINSDSLKIITVEDPIEYRFDGIVQVQVKADIGFDFASVLRSTLRHNPDVLLVGEIRDRETAQVAIQAALTGHLVLSTIHTNSAVATVARLVDMGIDPYLVAATLTGIVSQRLVPRLCSHCKIPDPAAAAALTRLEPESKLAEATLFRALGCDHCNMSGYSGRTVIYEMLEIGATERDTIGSSGDWSDAVAKAAGFRPLQTLALDKVRSGICALSDVLRATQLGT